MAPSTPYDASMDGRLAIGNLTSDRKIDPFTEYFYLVRERERLLDFSFDEKRH